MTTPNTTFTEMVTTTLRSHPSQVADNVSKHNALYRTLQKRGKIRKLDGGYEIVRPLEYAENGTFQRYSGYDPLNISASEVFSAAKYDWAQSAVHVTASGRELRMNSGKEQLIDLAESRTKNALKTASNNMSLDLYGSGSLTNQMTGLGALITTDGTGTVGGISTTGNTWWKNQFKEVSGTGAPYAGIKDDMMGLWISCVRGTDKPDLVVMTNDFWQAYWSSLTSLQRYNDVTNANAGFDSVKFQSTDVIHDLEATNFAATGEIGYFINSDYLELVVHRDANWTTLDEKMSINQDAVVIPVIWQGQLVTSNRSVQGRLLDAS